MRHREIEVTPEELAQLESEYGHIAVIDPNERIASARPYGTTSAAPTPPARPIAPVRAPLVSQAQSEFDQKKEA